MTIELDSVASGYNRQKIDANFQKIEEELNNNVLNSGVGNNTLTTTLNVNSQRVINLADPVDPQDAATRAYVDGGFTESAQQYLDQVISNAALAQDSAIAAGTSEASAAASATSASTSATEAAASAASIDTTTLLNRSNHTGTQTLSTISDAGTAASANVTTSATDTTAGRVLTTGTDVYRPANILAPVSQSGGVPTGGIVEQYTSGTTTVTKYAGGRMVMTGTLPDMTAPATSVFVLGSVGFPESFANGNYFFSCVSTPLSSSDYVQHTYSNISPTPTDSISPVALNSFASTQTITGIKWTAIGEHND